MFLAFVKAERSDSTPGRFGGVGCPEIYMTFANPPPKLILAVSRFACSRLTARSFLSSSLPPCFAVSNLVDSVTIVVLYSRINSIHSKLKPERREVEREENASLVKYFRTVSPSRKIDSVRNRRSVRQRSRKSRFLSPWRRRLIA